MDSTSKFERGVVRAQAGVPVPLKTGRRFFCGSGGLVTGLNSTVAAMDGLYFEFEREVVRAQAGVLVPLKTGRQSAAL